MFQMISIKVYRISILSNLIREHLLVVLSTDFIQEQNTFARRSRIVNDISVLSIKA